MNHQYAIIDNQTKQQIGKLYSSRAKTSARANKLDLAYGAIRYNVKIIWSGDK